MLIGIHELRQYYADYRDVRHYALYENGWWDRTLLASALLAADEARTRRRGEVGFFVSSVGEIKIVGILERDTERVDIVLLYLY